MLANGRRTRPDIVFTRQRLAVFIDGCFWHCCPEHGRTPGTNTEYWSPKLAKNMERDKLQTAALVEDGWEVQRIWEHVATLDAAREIAVAVVRLRGLESAGGKGPLDTS